MLNRSEADFKIVYLLGAGFSSAITNGKAPLTAELGEKLNNTFPDDIREKFNFAQIILSYFLLN